MISFSSIQQTIIFQSSISIFSMGFWSFPRLAHGAALLGFLRLVHRRRFLRPAEVRTALAEVAEPAPGQAAGLAVIPRCDVWIWI